MSGMLAVSGVTADDVVYTVLPLYHVMGLVLGVLSCLELGEPFLPWGPLLPLPGKCGLGVGVHPVTRDIQQRASPIQDPWAEGGHLGGSQGCAGLRKGQQLCQVTPVTSCQ